VKAALFGLLAAQSSLTALIPSSRWYRAGNVVDTPVKPFVVLRWIAPVRGDARGTFAKQLRLEVHAARGSYKPCEDWLKLARPVLSSAQDYLGSDGRITQCDYLGNSGDQEDETYKTNLMFDSWQVIGVDL
jgi:hypothetical protein